MRRGSAAADEVTPLTASSSPGRSGAASAPPDLSRRPRSENMQPTRSDGRNLAERDIPLFRQKIAFLGLLTVAFTGAVTIMMLLRPVLEPFMWALFLVIAIQPISTFIEDILICVGRCVCGGGGCGRYASPDSSPVARSWPRGPHRPRRCRLRGEDDPEVEARCVEDVSGRSSVEGSPSTSTADLDDSELWDAPRVGGICGSCCECLSRIVAVAGAVAVVLGVAVAVATPIVEGVFALRENAVVYDQGVRNAVESVKLFIANSFSQVPSTMVDRMSDSAMLSAKTIIAELLADFTDAAGRMLVELLMLGLYVMFWLCTPMPLNTRTERIFRRYLALKGSACLCYGICVGLMLRGLNVDCALVFGLTSFLLAFIPEVGAFFAMALPMPVVVFDSRLPAPWLTLVIATAGQLCLKFVFANIIEVKLVENDATMKMHPVVTLLTVTFFGSVWGPTGMLLSVPIMTYMKVMLLSDRVPSAYRDPVLVLLEGDRGAPERHRKRLERRTSFPR